MSDELNYLTSSYTEDELSKGVLSRLQRVNKWDLRFLALAKLVSSWSKDPSTQTGAIIVDRDGAVVSLGYNGFARGVEDTPERWNNRELKYPLVVHCERNAIIFAKRDLSGCTLYTWPLMSCSPCAGMVVQAGITRCVAPENDNPRWQADFVLSKQQFAEAGVQLHLIPGLL
jgi:dCMP deaminase